MTIQLNGLTDPEAERHVEARSGRPVVAGVAVVADNAHEARGLPASARLPPDAADATVARTLDNVLCAAA